MHALYVQYITANVNRALDCLELALKPASPDVKKPAYQILICSVPSSVLFSHLVLMAWLISKTEIVQNCAICFVLTFALTYGGKTGETHMQSSLSGMWGKCSSWH